MTPWVLRIIAANVGVYLLTMANRGIALDLAFQPNLPWLMTHPWSPITYMFVHGGIWHILFNMLSLYFFGPRVEQRLGGGRFVGLYLVSGLSGAVLSVLTPNATIIGASGAVFGVLAAYARYWPHDHIYLYGVIPIEARIFVVIMAGLSLYGGWNAGFQPGIAHFAHLGGFIGGILYLIGVDRRSKAPRVGPSGPTRRIVPGSDDLTRWSMIRRDALHEINRTEVDRLLDKVKTRGPGSLTEDERAALDRFSRQ